MQNAGIKERGNLFKAGDSGFFKAVCGSAFLSFITFLNILLQFIGFIGKCFGQKSHFPQAVLDHIENFIGRSQQGMIMIPFRCRGQKRGLTALDRFEELCHIQPGADVELAAKDSIDTVVDKDIFDHRAAVHEKVQLFLAFLP